MLFYPVPLIANNQTRIFYIPLLNEALHLFVSFTGIARKCVILVKKRENNSRQCLLFVLNAYYILMSIAARA